MRPPLMLLACAVLLHALSTGIAQEVTHKPISVVEDWSTHQVVFGEDVPRELWPTVLADSRFWQQYYRRHRNPWPCPLAEANEREPRCGRVSGGPEPVKRDWSVMLGATMCAAGSCSGGPLSQPAKFTYDVNATPSCTTDYVVTGINAAGSTTTGSMQANIIGLNNLYNGTCTTGTVPNVMFSYYVGTGMVPSSSVVSLDGKKVAFIENISTTSSKLHILTIGTTGTNGTSATAPVAVGSTGGNNAVDTQVTFTAASSTAPFVDYDDDVAYVTTNGSASVVHKITGVFRGTPTEVTPTGTTGWPATISGNPSISTPVFDFTSKHVILEDATGHLDYVDDSVSPAVTHSGSLSVLSTGATSLNATPVVIDSSRNLVYALANNPSGSSCLVAETNTSLSSTLATVNLGTGMSAVMRQVDFNNTYYATSTFGSAFMYVVGNDSTTQQHPALYDVGFSNSSFTLKTTTANGPLALSTGTTTGVYASPVTEFYNSKLATPTDFLFVGVSGSCSTSITGGCMRSLNITSAFPTTSNVNSVILAATGGTGRASVDNYSTSAGASSIYYTTLTGNTIVKATQSGLN